MTSMSALSIDDLRSVFTRSPPVKERVGIEVETAPLSPITGLGVAYEGKHGLGAFLSAACYRLAAEPVREQGNIVGLTLADGGQISLENGGALEYSSPPMATVTEAVDITRANLHVLAQLAAEHDFSLVPGANFPFNTITDLHWVPNARGDLMRAHFAALGTAGAYGPHVMGLTLSTQATFDYSDEADLVEKLRMQAAVSTVATALFVNSPLDVGRPCGALSRRMQFFARFDPERDRVVPATLGDVSLDRFITWALSIPMVYRKRRDGVCERAPRRPFSDLLRSGFDDGERPEIRDWSAHLSQIYSDVRVRSTLEVRAVDGPPYRAFASVPAFWTGLTYHAPSRSQAWNLVRHATLPDHLEALDDIAVHGLRATFAGQPVAELAAELLRLSEAGLRARVAAGLEDERALSFLDSIREVSATGDTFAERALREDCSPGRYVAAHRVNAQHVRR
jgi:glutamate--cysteine ligase